MKAYESKAPKNEARLDTNISLGYRASYDVILLSYAITVSYPPPPPPPSYNSTVLGYHLKQNKKLGGQPGYTYEIKREKYGYSY